MKDGRISYVFLDDAGEYYGGEALPLGAMKPSALVRVVFFNPEKPDLNRIVMGLLFHRLVIIGRGLTDLEHATAVGKLEPRLLGT